MSRMGSAPTAEGPYRGAQIAVGTRHGKQHQFSAAFGEVLGAELITPPDLDTDRLGTFSGERPREASAVAAARGKAAMAMDATGLSCGLASEASYGPLPGSGVPGHEEILLFCDADRGIEVLEGYRTTHATASRHEVARCDDLPASVLDALPDQALIVRPHGQFVGITKGITDIGTLRRVIAGAVSISHAGLAAVEPDLRAHHNPTRREVLVRLARTLAERLATPCPSCGCPGFGRVDTEPGQPCRVCHTPTALARHEIHACPACGHSLTREVAARAEPRDCPACNP